MNDERGFMSGIETVIYEILAGQSGCFEVKRIVAVSVENIVNIIDIVPRPIRTEIFGIGYRQNGQNYPIVQEI